MENCPLFSSEVQKVGRDSQLVTFCALVLSANTPFVLPLWLCFPLCSCVKALHLSSLHLSFSLASPVYPSSFTCSCVLNLFHLRAHYNRGNRNPHHNHYQCSFAASVPPPPLPRSRPSLRSNTQVAE